MAAGFLAGAFALYAPSLGNAFLYDDAAYLVTARAVADDASRVFGADPQGSYRPVWLAWLAALQACFGLRPAGYFSAGVALHAVNACLVWRLARRAIGGERAPLVAGATYLALFAHCEAMLWISAQNSALVTAFALAAVLAHLRAIETASALRAALAVALAGAAIFTKETGLAVAPWLVLAQGRVFGWRSCASRASWLRFAALAVPVAVYAAANPAMAAALGGGADASTRSSLAHATPSRIVTTWAWLFGPVPWTYRDARPALAAALLAMALAAAWRLRVLAPVAFGVALSVAALLPVATTPLAMTNGSRQYVTATVGAALVVGAFARAARGRAAHAAFLAVWLAALGAHALAIRRLNDAFYRPESLAQTRMGEEIGPLLPRDGEPPTFVEEPAVSNLAHFKQFLFLFHGFSSEAIAFESVPRAELQAWRDARATESPAPRVVGWDDARGFVPAGELGVPPSRTARHLRALGLGADVPDAGPVVVARVARAE